MADSLHKVPLTSGWPWLVCLPELPAMPCLSDTPPRWYSLSTHQSDYTGKRLVSGCFSLKYHRKGDSLELRPTSFLCSQKQFLFPIQIVSTISIFKWNSEKNYVSLKFVFFFNEYIKHTYLSPVRMCGLSHVTDPANQGQPWSVTWYLYSLSLQRFVFEHKVNR